MRFKLMMRKGERQETFLDLLSSAFMAVISSASGTALTLEDGRFVASTTAAFPIGSEQVSLTWALTTSRDGTLESVEVLPADSDPHETGWENFVRDFMEGVRSRALADTRERYFCSRRYFYMGASLDGEYWLPGFRFAPTIPDDETPTLHNVERAVTIDMNIDAIDRDAAEEVAGVRGRRHAARLSLVLDAGLYESQSVHRWVLLPNEDGSRRCERHQLGFRRSDLALEAMPKEGKVCRLGEFRGSVAQVYGTASHRLHLPEDTLRVFQALESAVPAVRKAFDRCARLYQVALVCGAQFPSVGMAYRVAAVDAISETIGEPRGFKEFVKDHVPPGPDLERILKFLWGSARSQHLHVGLFPMGEFDRARFMLPQLDPGFMERSAMQRAGYEVTRQAIVRWIVSIVPADSDETG